MRRLLLIALVLCGCKLLEDEPEGMPPPVGESNGSMSGVAGTAGSSGGSSTGGSGGSSSGAADSSTGPAPLDLGMGVLMVGTLQQGDGAWTLPMDCNLRFFLPEQLNTATGVASGWEADVPVTITEFPQSFMLGADDFSDNVMSGTEGYVGIRCDLEGDGVLDNVGAYYPQLPPELIMVPVDGIDLEIVFL